MRSLHRRTILSLAVGVATSMAGCLDDGDGDDGGGDDDSTGSPDSIVSHDTLPYTVTSSVPHWHQEDETTTGRVVVIDSDTRQRAVLSPADVPEHRRTAFQEFLDDADYDTSVVLLIESVGPNACYDRLKVEDVRVDDGRLAASATVVDTSDPDTACAQVITYPSILLRVDFEDDPVTKAIVDLTDGWDRTESIAASPNDSLSPAAAELPGFVRPDGDPTPIEPLECEREGFLRHWRGYDEDAFEYGELTADGEVTFALRIAETSYERSDTARIQLVNVSDRKLQTGNRYKYGFEMYTEDGWQDVRGHVGDNQLPYTDEAVGHRPGEGFEWTFTLTEEGIVANHVHDRLEVCPDLADGRYRFAYWGIIGDDAVGVEFDLS
ncbi:MAG: hypothetical protein ACLFNI_09530 [Natronomonas sp.]